MRRLAALVAACLLAAGARDPLAAQAADSAARYPVPFGIGERLVYEVKFGPLKVGHGTMEVLDIVSLRGREAWHTRFRVRGGVPLYRVDDVLESWIDVAAFHALRFVQDFDEGGKTRERRYEIFPDRRVFQEGDKPEETSVPDPLDDGSFLYFIRTIPLVVGETYEFNRYFRPDRNPVIVKVVGKETIRVPAGRYETIVIQPVIKSRGIFSENGQARIWLSDDPSRIMVQMKTKTRIGSLNLYLQSHRPAPTTPQRTETATR